ncbi:MAG: hypothetical protein RRY26_11935 [Cellulosilyticaceae bacterium]
MNPIFIKTQGVEDWSRLVANKKLHWKVGYSAKSLANAWEASEGFPSEVKVVFKASQDQCINNLELLYAFPEYNVKLPGGNRDSQNDLYVLARSDKEYMCIMVEGKKEESFGDRVEKWVETASDGWQNVRLQYILHKLDLVEKRVKNIRYQLLHRTLSALLEAEYVKADKCMVMIYSFSEHATNFKDYEEFVQLFGVTPKKKEVCGPINIKNKQVYFTWVEGNQKYTQY